MSPVLFASLLAAAPVEPPGVAEVREVYAACTALKQRASPSVYVEVELGQDRTRWIREEANDGGSPVYSAARVYRDGELTRFAELEESSASGDWAQVTEYCFRADGSLAFLFSTLRTFYGGVHAETRRYYSPAGKLLLTRRVTLDLKTRQPTKAEFMDRQAELYLTAKKLLARVSP